MAIYGVGAYYKGQSHKPSNDFKDNNIIGIGWSIQDAPDLHEYLRIVEAGDIIYIKAAAFGNPTKVKAVGIITDSNIISGTFGVTYISIGRNVKWLDKSEFTLKILPGKNNVRSNTMYRETHPEHIKAIMKIVNDAINKL